MVSTAISLVIAAALTIAVQAAPAIESTFKSPPVASTTFAPPPTSTLLPPSDGSSKNGTRPITGRYQLFTITDDSVLRNAIVDYNYKDAAKHIARYCKAVHGNKTAPRTNVVSSRAATSTDILPSMSALSMILHQPRDIHRAKYPICVGYATGPNRSILFSDKTTCSIDEFSHDFSFYESGMKRSYDATVNSLHEPVAMLQASNPHRMMMCPYYQGNKHGWQ
ncbi:hypothetical protein BG015_010017 [Linnemannia schmuckeri]|uniref:Uncharacterized protein n=1 Tax=Linnemannia schmuckeri TaxID=64567 RepID=A0A9P5RXE0_9FUNG|nr:hypothetical protein BG015_010017 [Linnemannia schmuckeri]